MSLNFEGLFTLWNETVSLTCNTNKISLNSIDENVLKQIKASFDKVSNRIPEDILPAYFCYVIKLCKKLKIHPHYRMVSSEKNMSDFLKTRGISLQTKRNLVVSGRSVSDELKGFIDEVKKLKQTLNCSNDDAIILARTKYLWSNNNAIDYFISRCKSGDTKFLNMLS